MEIIKEMHPKIIVVCDTFSRNLIKEDLEKDFNPKIGTYCIEDKNSKLQYFSLECYQD